MDIRAVHPYASFWLDVADKAIKFAAVCIGGIWTWWNYRKGRTYEHRLDIGISGTISLRRDALYLDIQATAKNIGNSVQPIEQRGTYCDVSLIREDLSESVERVFSVFELHNQLEPSEPMTDTLYWRIGPVAKDIVWVRLRMRVVSDKLESNTSSLVRVDIMQQDDVKES